MWKSIMKGPLSLCKNAKCLLTLVLPFNEESEQVSAVSLTQLKKTWLLFGSSSLIMAAIVFCCHELFS